MSVAVRPPVDPVLGPCRCALLLRPSLLLHAEHFVAEWMRDFQMVATLVQCHVDHFLDLTDPDTSPPRMHQDVFAEVLSGQAEVDEGGA